MSSVYSRHCRGSLPRPFIARLLFNVARWILSPFLAAPPILAVCGADAVGCPAPRFRESNRYRRCKTTPNKLDLSSSSRPQPGRLPNAAVHLDHPHHGSMAFGGDENQLRRICGRRSASNRPTRSVSPTLWVCRLRSTWLHSCPDLFLGVAATKNEKVV